MEKYFIKKTLQGPFTIETLNRMGLAPDTLVVSESAVEGFKLNTIEGFTETQHLIVSIEPIRTLDKPYIRKIVTEEKTVGRFAIAIIGIIAFVMLIFMQISFLTIASYVAIVVFAVFKYVNYRQTPEIEATIDAILEKNQRIMLLSKVKKKYTTHDSDSSAIWHYLVVDWDIDLCVSEDIYQKIPIGCFLEINYIAYSTHKMPYSFLNITSDNKIFAATTSLTAATVKMIDDSLYPT